MREHEQRNRAFWDADADDYQAAHGDELKNRPLAWGVWRIPETELAVLGDVAGLSMLEYGCGAAQWSVALASLGARPVGLDLSAAQLRHARADVAAAGVDVPLVNATAEETPFADASFDIVFCDHGAMSFCDPAQTVPEAARLLRPGGILAFCASTPLLYITYDIARDRQTRTLRLRYDRLGRMDGGEGTIDWVLPPGDWIRLFRESGLEVEDLHELRAPKGATTSYTEFVGYDWARRWPAEWIWKARKLAQTR